MRKQKHNLSHVLHIASNDIWASAEVSYFYQVKTLQNKFSVPVVVILLNYGELENYLHKTSFKVIGYEEPTLSKHQILRKVIYFQLLGGLKLGWQ